MDIAQRIHYQLREEEQEALDGIVDRLGVPTSRILRHFFEAMVPITKELLLPEIPPAPHGENKVVRITQEVYDLIDQAAKNRSLHLQYMGRVLALRTLEFFEDWETNLMPGKEDIQLWLESRSAKSSKPGKHWYSGFLPRHK